VLALVGPAACGKSTVGAAAAAALGAPFVDADEAGEPYYREVGWDLGRLRERIAAVGRSAAERDWEPARAHAVGRLVSDHPGAVLALGAGHTSYADPAHRSAVAAALARAGSVVLLLPAAGRDEALRVLRARSLAAKGTDWVRDGRDFLAGWLDDPAPRALATHVLVTGDEAPARTAERVVAIARAGAAAGSAAPGRPGRA
jgi:hypothetical protein